MLRMFLLWVAIRAAKGVCYLDGSEHVGVTVDREDGHARITVLDQWSLDHYRQALPCHKCPDETPEHPTKKEQAAASDLLPSRKTRDLDELNDSVN